MRYTTIIDISEFPALYRNAHVRLVYLHLALRSGYHDTDRDLMSTSIRRLAAAVGLSVSATRHALAQLEKAQLVTRQGPLFQVKKWILQETITTRPKTIKQQKAIEQEATRRIENEKREREAAIEKERREQIAAAGKTSFMLYYEGLQTKAAAGDIEAAKLLERHRKTYEAHKAQFDKTKRQ